MKTASPGREGSGGRRGKQINKWAEVMKEKRGRKEDEEGKWKG